MQIRTLFANSIFTLCASTGNDNFDGNDGINVAVDVQVKEFLIYVPILSVVSISLDVLGLSEDWQAMGHSSLIGLQQKARY